MNCSLVWTSAVPSARSYVKCFIITSSCFFVFLLEIAIFLFAEAIIKTFCCYLSDATLWLLILLGSSSLTLTFILSASLGLPTIHTSPSS